VRAKAQADARRRCVRRAPAASCLYRLRLTEPRRALELDMSARGMELRMMRCCDSVLLNSKFASCCAHLARDSVHGASAPRAQGEINSSALVRGFSAQSLDFERNSRR